MGEIVNTALDALRQCHAGKKCADDGCHARILRQQ